MSGVFGVFNRNRAPVDGGQLTNMYRSIAFRGMDRHSTRVFEYVSMGHVMLYTTPQSRFEKLPWQDSNSGIIITCDARLDNRQDLMGEFLPGELAAAEITDSYLVMKAYEKWGGKFAEHLLGDFVVVLWDSRNQILCCARDHMGVKPLFYLLNDQQFIFASEARAIHAYMEGKLPVNKQKIADYLLGHQAIDFESSYFKDVKRLPPAYCMRVGFDRVKRWRYWQPRYSELRISEDEAVYEFSRLLAKAVDDRLVSDGPVGCLLSGGIDSASVHHLASLQAQQPVTTYSGVSQNEDCLETQAIMQLVGGARDVELLNVHAVGEKSLELMHRLDDLDDPFASTMTMVAALYERANCKGNRVVLDGVEGDIVVSLPSSYPAGLLRGGSLGWAFKELVAQNRSGKIDSLPLGLLRSVRAAVVPYWYKLGQHRLTSKHRVGAEFQDSLLSSALQNDADLVDRYIDYYRSTLTPIMRPGRHHEWMLNQPYLVSALERYDRIGALFGVEPRHPFLDKRLVEFCLNLPISFKVRAGVSKWVLREAMSSLPESIAWRTDKPHLGWSFTREILRRNWATYKGFVIENKELWTPYMDEERVLPYFSSSTYNPLEEVSDPWDIAQLIKWLQLFD